MYEYLCSCIPWGRDLVQAGVNRVVGYLNSNNMNQQILEEEKCVDDYQDQQQSGHQHQQPSIFEINKKKAFKTVNHEDEEHHINNEQQQEVAQDVDSLPREERFSVIAHKAMDNLRKHLMVEPEEEYFQLLVDSQDQTDLVVYYRLFLNEESRRLSLFRFRYTLNMTLQQYKTIFTQEVLRSLEVNLSSFEEVEKISKDLSLCYSQYKKVLVVMPRDFLYLKSAEQSESIYTTVSVSVPEDNLKPIVKDLVRGRIILVGTVVEQIENKVVVHTYLEIDLDLNINPLMMKQPAVREIKKYVQKIVEFGSSQTSKYPKDSGLMESIEGI